MLVLLGLCACASGGGGSAEAEGSSGDPAYLLPREGRAMLTVFRDASSAADDRCMPIVAIDAQVAGTLTPTGWITMYPPPGTHTLRLSPSGASCPLQVELRVVAEADRHQRVHVVRSADGSVALRVVEPAR